MRLYLERLPCCSVNNIASGARIDKNPFQSNTSELNVYGGNIFSTRLFDDLAYISFPGSNSHLSPSPKFRQPLDLQCNVVYKIPCSDCCWSYVGETGRCFKTQRKEHQRNLKNYTSGSNIANHAWENNHAIDFEGATVIDKGNYRVRKTLESWHTAKTVGADNNSKPLPRQYSILL